MTGFPDIERQVEFDFLRATEIAALNTLQWLGKGQKELADAAACDAIRGMFDLIDMRGEITIGEGIKDESPGLFKGERVGTWREGAPRVEIALDPIDGTTNVAKGMPNSLSCIAAALAPAMRTSSIDLYVGIGGSPEAVLAAAGLRCLGGGMRAKIWPRDDAERQALVAAGWGDRLDTQFMSRDLARGDNLVFVATGISTGPLIKGVEVRGSVALTSSVLMRARSGTVRFIESHHDLERKTIHLRSTQAERRI